MASSCWTVQKSEQFWSQRQLQVVLCDPSLRERNRLRLPNCRDRQERLSFQEEQFKRENGLEENEAAPCVLFQNASKDLSFWMKHGSWNFCNKCSGLLNQKLLPNYCSRKPLVAAKKCSCADGRYHVIETSSIPAALKGLTEADIVTLRPLDVHCGEYTRMKNGYRQRTGTFHVSWSKNKVEDKIQQLQSTTARHCCEKAFTFLMEETRSSYKNFVEMRGKNKGNPSPVALFTGKEFSSVECALWPHLYYSREMCETVLTGETSRQSRNVSYMRKVLSTVPE